MKRTISTAVIAAAMLASVPGARAASEEVNLYSYRQPFLIQPMLDVFTEKTGITVNVAYAEEGMLERIKAEGENTPADAVLTADIGRLKDMEDAGVLAAVNSEVLSENIPAAYRHPDGYWFGLTTRARIIFASKDRVGADEVTSYEDLADPKMKGRICIRSGKHLYNISLIASMIVHKGVEETEKWLLGVKANLARKPQGNDRAQAKAIYEGQCDVAIANTYYMGNMQTNDEKPEQKEWASAINIIFPNQGDRGTHVNISGAAVLKHAKRKENAVKLLEFLASETAQSMYAAQNFEYPVKPGVAVSERVQSWGSFKADTISLSEVAKHRAEAARMVDRIGFDQ
ncbi:MAG: Fe(3+) ABC transporter substrate-binding protein [Notoacmeibacter sp.]|nr:Fe(3+) ABC transporter substrate-binding protein [Notoacmeibacter sp.]